MKKPWPERFWQRSPDVREVQRNFPANSLLSPYFKTRARGSSAVSPTQRTCTRPVGLIPSGPQSTSQPFGLYCGCEYFVTKRVSQRIDCESTMQPMLCDGVWKKVNEAA